MTTDHPPELKPGTITASSWDPLVVLEGLAVLEKKIHQLQDAVRATMLHPDTCSPDDSAARQHLLTADLTCAIIQLISTAGSFLPSVQNSLLAVNPLVCQLGITFDPSPPPTSLPPPQLPPLAAVLPEHDTNEAETDSGTGGGGENPTPGSYVVLQLEKDEILAPHTHFCTVCGKGFKRDANLRMHMRGHGDEYKSAAALAKPARDITAVSGGDPATRYSCPFVGCKRNREHKKFQPLKTVLCVKNHYRRSHCDKSFMCRRCNSKWFSVMADLKTHEKHCGQERWVCSCGTTFSRKDKLFGHVALFQGHAPALPSEPAPLCSEKEEELSRDIMFDEAALSPLDFGGCDFGGLDEFIQLEEFTGPFDAD